MRILVVDDDVAVSRITVAMLKHLGHRAESLSHGQNTLDLLRFGGFEVLFADIPMAGMGGIALVRTVLEEKLLPAHRIIATAVLHFDDEPIHWLTANRVLILFKPYGMESVKWAIDTVTASA